MNAPTYDADDPKAAFWATLRKRMVDQQLFQRGITDERILMAFESLPRHLFVPPKYRGDAYEDTPLPIGRNQTISQPFVVAYMLSQLHLKSDERVLEIGTGCGYQTALLSHMVREVYSIEILPELYRYAHDTLAQLNISNVHLRDGDGYEGWPSAAPFNAVVVSAAPRKVPKQLVKQLCENGRMIVPVGRISQRLLLITRNPGKVDVERKISVRFVPMIHG